MLWSLAVLFIVFWGNAYLVAVIFFGAALHVYALSLGIELGVLEALVLLGVSTAIPLTAYGTGMLLDHYSLAQVGGVSFRMLGIALSCWLALSSNAVIDCFALIGQALPELTPQGALVLLSSVISAASLCAGLTALVFMLLHAGIELPLSWVQGAARTHVDCSLAAARPLIILAGLAAGFYLVTGFFAAELAPPVLIAAG